MRKRRLMPSDIEPNSWKRGGLQSSGDERHGNVRTIYHRDFPAIEGSQTCSVCRRAIPPDAKQCNRCNR